MTNEELTKYSGEHLLYEITMFWWLSGAIWYTDGYMHDALLESWVGHLRNLINFLCRPRQQDDVIAADFFDNPGAWPQSESDKLKTARVRADKELSHITGKRKYTSDKDKGWDVAGLFHEIEGIAKKFAATASEVKLHPDVRLLKKPRSEAVVLLKKHSQSTNTAVGRGSLLSSDWKFGKDTF
jgi:hypothetical protein